MSWETYMAYLAVVAVFFATPPGPSQLLMIANSLTHGLRRSVATVAGDLSANALQMTAAAFGLAAAIAQSAALLSAIKWAGVAYLIWLGIGKLLSRRAPHGADAAARGRPALLYRQGFLTSAANPKAVIFFAALFPQFIDPAHAVWPQLLILGATYLTVDGAILLAMGAAAERTGGGLRHWRGGAFERFSGALMIGAAVLLAGKELGDARPAPR